MRQTLFTLLAAALLLAANASAEPADPLGSPSWPDVRRKLIGEDRVVFDPRVTVLAPAVAEDSMNVPVTVSLDGMVDVRRVLVVADLNPILRVLEFEPLDALPRISFRIKLQQGSPVRAMAQTSDGVWHIGGTWVDAAGGGCTAPSVGSSNANWTDTLGEVDARWWRRDGRQRLKFKVMHPMDTGLAPGIPAFFIERLALRDADGRDWVRLRTFEPLSENPLFSLEFDRPTPPLQLIGVDNNGNRIDTEMIR